MKQQAYLNFPLVMLKKTIHHPEAGMSDIGAYGIRLYAQHCRRNPDSALAQLAYISTRRPDEALPRDVETLSRRQDVAAFIDGTSDAWLDPAGFEQGALDMLKDSPVELDADDSEALSHWLALRDAAAYFGRRIINYTTLEKQVKTIQKEVDTHASQTGAPVTGRVPAQYFFETAQTFSDLEAMRMFRCVVAVRSIVGHKRFTGTTKDMLRARMIGAKSPSVATALADYEPAVKAELAAMQSRKRFDRILTEAAVRGFLVKVGMGRRVYLSLTAKNPEELASWVKAKFNRLANYREQEREARKGQQGDTDRGTEGDTEGDSFKKSLLRSLSQEVPLKKTPYKTSSRPEA